MRVWVTRTEPQAHDTAQRLRAMGHEPVVAPVLMVRGLPINIDLGGFAALAFTSRNAVVAFARTCRRRDLPVFVTGPGTAAEAQSAGFAEVISAEGDVTDLAALIAQARPAGKVLHAAAVEMAGDLAGELARAGVEVRTLPVYETVETGVAAPQDIEGVVIHSPRAARAVAEVIRPQEATTITAFCISEAAAAPISYSKFQRVAVAPYPNEQSLLKLLER